MRFSSKFSQKLVISIKLFQIFEISICLSESINDISDSWYEMVCNHHIFYKSYYWITHIFFVIIDLLTVSNLRNNLGNFFYKCPLFKRIMNAHIFFCIGTPTFFVFFGRFFDGEYDATIRKVEKVDFLGRNSIKLSKKNFCSEAKTGP